MLKAYLQFYQSFVIAMASLFDLRRNFSSEVGTTQDFFFFWLRWVYIVAHRLSLVVASRGYSSLWYAVFSLWWLLLLRSMGSRHAGFSSCSTWAQQLWHTGLVAPQHVGSSRTRDRTHVPCIGRRILNHCPIREVPGQHRILIFLRHAEMFLF